MSKRKRSQNIAVGSFLKKNHSISPAQAIKMGIHRLGARIFDLREVGWLIKTKMTPTTGKLFNPGRFAVYILIKAGRK